MTDQGETAVAPDTGASGEDQAGQVKGQSGEGIGANSGDVNNNGNADNEMAVTGAENHASGAAAEGEVNEGGARAPEGGQQKVDEDLGVNGQAKFGIQDKDPEEIDQFDSVSNAVSQHERPDAKADKFNKKDAVSIPQPTETPVQQTPTVQPTPTKAKKVKKGIFTSYSPDAGFVERKFVVETVKQLKENNLAEDIWFDKDENKTGSPCWFSLRMEAVEKCRAAILFLSDSYFMCPVSVYEGKALLERVKTNPHSVAIFPILFSPIEKVDPPKEFVALLKQAVDLTGEHCKLSLAERSSVVIGTIMETLEKFACMNLPLQITSPDTEFTGNYRKKKICQWDASDLQEWLFKLGIKEFYRQSLAENMVDGFLLMSLTDHDMVSHLGIDSRVVRKKIMQNILLTLDKEHKQTDNWHLRARSQRAKPDVVYLIYDPADVRLAQNMKMDLRKKGLQVNM